MEPKLSLYLLATEEFLKDFKTLCDLSTSQLKEFVTTIKSENDFDFSQSVIKILVKKIHIEPQKLISSTTVSKYLYKQVLQNELNKEEIKLELKLLAEKNGIKLSANKLSILTDFFNIPSTLRESHNKLPYKNSIIPLLSAVTPLFDLRAIFDDSDGKNDKLKIKSFIPIVIIRITAEDDKENTKSFEFQTGLDGLDSFITMLQEYKKKLEAVDMKTKNL